MVSFFNLFKNKSQDFNNENLGDSAQSLDTKEFLNSAKSILQELIDNCNFKGEVVAIEKNNTILLEIVNNSDAGRIIGKDGKTLEAFQTITRAIFYKHFPNCNYQLVVDLEHYRKKRIEKVKKAALSIAYSLSDKTPSKALEPMTAQERRAIHLLFENNDQFKTFSKNKGASRYVVIEKVQDNNIS